MAEDERGLEDDEKGTGEETMLGKDKAAGIGSFTLLHFIRDRAAGCSYTLGRRQENRIVTDTHLLMTV